MLGTGYFLKIAKINSRKTQKNRQSAKINSRKIFVRQLQIAEFDRDT